MRTRTRMDSKLASKRVTVVLLAATMFLLVDSVAASRSRFLQIVPAANVIEVDTEPGTHFITAAVALRGSKSHRSFTQRTLLQSLPTPYRSGGDGPHSGARIPPPGPPPAPVGS